MGPKPAPVVLSDEERSVLTGWARRRKTSQALRSRIVLACAEGGTIGEVACKVGVSRNTVSKWRARFLSDRLEGLSDEPRPGRPRSITDERVEQVIRNLRGNPRLQAGVAGR
jgi:transposase